MVTAKKRLVISTLVLLLSLLVSLFVPIKNVNAYNTSNVPNDVVGELFDKTTSEFYFINATLLKNKLGSLYDATSLKTAPKTSADIMAKKQQHGISSDPRRLNMDSSIFIDRHRWQCYFDFMVE